MKHSIRKRLQLILTLFTCCSILVSMVASFLYCRYQLRSHILSNQESKMELMAAELDDIATDVQQVGMLLAFNERLQKYLVPESLSVSDKIALQQTLKNEMKNYILQRDYIINFVVLGKSRLLVSNSQHGIYVSEKDYEKLISQDTYKILSDGEIGFSYGPSYPLKLHMQSLNDGLDSVNVLPYVVDVVDSNNIYQPVGRLLVNVGYEYLFSRIRGGIQDSDDFLFFDSYNQKIYQQNSLFTDSAQKDFLEMVKDQDVSQTTDKPMIYSTSDGYLVYWKSDISGWLLASYISKSTITQQSLGLLVLFLGLGLLFIALVALLSRKIAESITHPLIALTNTTQQISDGNTALRAEVTTEDEIGTLAKGFNHMLTQLNVFYEKNLLLEKKSREIELDLLSAQINPHFIYNTLQTIIYLAAKNDSKTIASLTRSFIGLLQNTVKISDKRLETKFCEEVKAVKDYIEVQNYRYAGKFSVQWDISPETENCLVPKTSLQPIVENSLLHGVFSKEKGSICITSKCTDGTLKITVEDNGVGMSPETIHSLLTEPQTNKNTMRTIGIPNIQNRIKYLYGENYGISIDSRLDEYTRISLTLPIHIEN